MVHQACFQGIHIEGEGKHQLRKAGVMLEATDCHKLFPQSLTNLLRRSSEDVGVLRISGGAAATGQPDLHQDIVQCGPVRNVWLMPGLLYKLPNNQDNAS